VGGNGWIEKKVPIAAESGDNGNSWSIRGRVGIWVVVVALVVLTDGLGDGGMHSVGLLSVLVVSDACIARRGI
jgi:hypothetical protein